MSGTYVTSDFSLPRSLDVQITLSRPQTELRTNLSIPCLVCEDLGLFPDANRVRFYSTLAAVGVDYDTDSEAYLGAAAFFSQTPRARTLAIGEAFLDPQPAYLASGTLTAAEIAAIAAITTGALSFAYNLGVGAAQMDLTGMSFSGCTTIEAVAAVIDAALGSDFVAAVKTLPGGSKVIALSTVATGDGVTISFPIAPATGTDMRTLLNFTAVTGGKVFNGYTPSGIDGELDNLQSAANAQSQFLYGWAFGASLRVVETQLEAATWALGQTYAIMALVTNDLTALDPAYDQDLGSLLGATGNRRAVAIYHDNPQRYPDLSILAYMLSVNYQMQDSAVTAKFKTLPGIETVQLTETQWIALQAKGYNTYTAVGNNARTYRDGTTEETTWYMDTTINLDNFVEDLSVNVYNVFLRNRKVPYTPKGQMLLVDACRDTGNQYTYNGVFADREVADPTRKSGYKVLPAVAIDPTPIWQMSVADRAARIGPPIALTVQEAGAIHSIAINVEVVS